MFINELPSLPPKREVEFTIELILGIEPISIPLDWIAPVESNELKESQDLLNKILFGLVHHLGELKCCL